MSTIIKPAVTGRPVRRNRAAPYLLVGPSVILLTVFGILPIIVAGGVSLTNLNIKGLGDPSKIKFVGFANYGKLWADPSFWSAMRITGLFVLVGVPVIVAISLTIALLLHFSGGRLARILRSFYFMPAIMAVVAISMVWGYLLNSQYGLANHALSFLGLGPLPWLTSPGWAKVSVGLVAVWRATGLNTIIFLAALQGIPNEYLEAAAIDGANAWQRISRITIPLLRFATFFVTVTTIINWLQFFDEPYVLTEGGPAKATTSISLYIFQQGFRQNQFGFASAGSIVLFIVIAVVTFIQIRARRSDDEI